MRLCSFVVTNPSVTFLASPGQLSTFARSWENFGAAAGKTREADGAAVISAPSSWTDRLRILHDAFVVSKKRSRAFQRLDDVVRSFVLLISTSSGRKK